MRLLFLLNLFEKIFLSNLKFHLDLIKKKLKFREYYYRVCRFIFKESKEIRRNYYPNLDFISIVDEFKKKKICQMYFKNWYSYH